MRLLFSLISVFCNTWSNHPLTAFEKQLGDIYVTYAKETKIAIKAVLSERFKKKVKFLPLL